MTRSVWRIKTITRVPDSDPVLIVTEVDHTCHRSSQQHHLKRQCHKSTDLDTKSMTNQASHCPDPGPDPVTENG
jgi:hypothetical protein